jgi:hypothetical protein
MSGDDADFAAYLAARWPSLVRTLVLIGLSRAEAQDTAVTGLARCRATWHRMREVDDLDVDAYRAVLGARPRVPDEREVVPLADPTEAERLREELEEQLGRLTVEQREAVVLRLVAGLDDVQVADVLDVAVDTAAGRVADGLARVEPPGLRSEDAFRTAAGSIEVPPPPYDAVAERVRRQRRRRWRIAAASVAAALVVVVVVGAVTWWTGRSEPEPAPPPGEGRVVARANPVDITWYDGRLHLRRVEVELPGLTALAGVGESAAFVDADGAVGIASPDGSVRRVGRSTAGARILGSAADGWVAWLEPGDGDARVVVWSVGLAEEVNSLPVPADTQLIAIDQQRVYGSTADGSFAWQPTAERQEALPESGLTAVGSATRVYQHGRRIEMVQPFFSVAFTRRGEGATLSPGGNFVLSRVPGPWVPGSPYTPLIYDTRSGARLPSGIAPDERVVDAAFGDHDRVDYLVANLADLQGVDLDGARSRLYVLRSCTLDTHVCSDVVPVRAAGDRPMLAP